MSSSISRRKLLQGAAVAATTAVASGILAACGKEIVKETVIVEQTKEVIQEVEVTKVVVEQKEVTKVVEKIVQVTPTPVPAPVNALGVALPADALPFEEQVVMAGIGGTGGGYGHIMESLYNRTFEHAGGQETLTSMDIDFNIYGVGCESWTVSDDGLVWDFKLRKDLVFSDGKPVTAKDWVYTMQWSLDHGYDFAWYYFDIKNAQALAEKKVAKADLGMKAVDDYTLRVETATPAPYLASLFVWFQVAQEGIFAQENWAVDPKRYISSGPFTLTKFDRVAGHLWELNPTYKGIRRPIITQIDESPLPTGASGLAAFLTGVTKGYSIGADTPSAEIAMVNTNPKLRALSHPGMATGCDYMGFNTLGTFEPMANPDVRMALCKAIDKGNLVGEIFKGFSYAQYGILPEGFPNSQNAALSQLDPNVYDPEAAKQLLAKAGFADGKGFPVYEWWLRGPSPKVTSLCEAIQARWKENLGITINIKGADFQSFTDAAFVSRTAPLYYVNYNMDYLDPATFMNIFKDGGRHPHADPAWTEFYNKANSTFDPVKRMELLRESEAQLVRAMGYYFMQSPFGFSLLSCQVAGETIQPNKDGFVFGGGGGPGMFHAYEGMYYRSADCMKS